MTTAVFIAVLFAALLHASWNVLVKGGADRFVSVALVALFAGLTALPLLPLCAALPAAAWYWLALSVLVHTAYSLFLSRAYSHGDLGQMYPLARGCAPLLVMLLSLLLLRETPSFLATAGALILIGGVLLMALRGASRRPLSGAALRDALLSALCTAGYTLTDGAGARAAGDALGYTLWLFALNGGVMLVWLWQRQGARTGYLIRSTWRRGLAGGAMSLLAYGIVIWAMTQAPIGIVAALRESSVLFALLLSARLLHEPLGRARVTAALVILCGVLLTRLG
ncbi:EamA family transporter [Edwardsiella tarda]|uniref:EamA family transporter n=1 Tax=Edwardsiella tarda TaxID=636 RepID=UPI003F66078F